jgi:hypothetical protein
MSGHVFHPGHEELHGITVVVEGISGRLYVGRYHERAAQGVVLHDAAVHEPGAAMSRHDWLARQHRFGVEAKHRNLLVPNDEAGTITRFSDLVAK